LVPTFDPASAAGRQALPCRTVPVGQPGLQPTSPMQRHNKTPSQHAEKFRMVRLCLGLGRWRECAGARVPCGTLRLVRRAVSVGKGGGRSRLQLAILEVRLSEFSVTVGRAAAPTGASLMVVTRLVVNRRSRRPMARQSIAQIRAAGQRLDLET
jgi:hypothetical protein